MIGHNQVAKKSNLKYSLQIDIEGLVVCQKKILRELEDYIIALPSNAIEYVDNRLAYLLYRPKHYNFISKSIFPTS